MSPVFVSIIEVVIVITHTASNSNESLIDGGRIEECRELEGSLRMGTVRSKEYV